MTAPEMLFALCIGHALADYPLQGDFLAQAKNRHLLAVPGESIWVGALLAHAAIHAGAVWLVTGNVWAALLELILHTLIDAAKCDRLFGFNVDQALHVGCKVVYVLIIAYA